MNLDEKQIRRDGLLGAAFTASSLLALALSLGVAEPDGRPLLFVVMLGISVVCLTLAKYRLGLVLGFLVVLVIRIAWGFIAY